MINNAISREESVQHTYYSVVRNSLVQMLQNPAGTVLEIGCGTGKTLEFLKINGARKVIGVELRKEVALNASQNKYIDKVYNVNFLDKKSPLKSYKFDTIILSHVLEHFTDPKLVLAKIRTHMHSKSTFLVAVPNIRHISVLLPLVFKGEFEYKDSGILDHTHFKFYTKNSIVNTLSKNGFVVQEVKMDFGGPKSFIANRLSFGLFKELIGYAINISASLSCNDM
jgi:2-polyprenyl-3-methyl-5-hydroxy-6-metoxy-1,4-benzoquinol methylase